MQEVINIYNEFMGFFPSYVGTFINFLILVLLVVIYSVAVWKGYKFISRKNFINLELSKYNQLNYPLTARLLAGTLYFLEYIIILPLLVFISLGVLTFFLIILSQTQDISQILIISAIIISAIRVTSYYKQELSQEIAKFLPMTLLAVAVLNPASFSQAQYLEKIVTHLSTLPAFIGQISYYLLIIIILEAILRFFDLIFILTGINQEKEEEKKVQGKDEIEKK